MKKLITILLLATSLAGFAQSPYLNDVVRVNPSSAIRTANALDALKPYTATGTDTYAVTILSGVLYAASATYVDGDMFTIVFTNANTTTTPTLNINTEGAVAIKDNDGTDPDVGAISGALQLRHNGTHFRVVGATGGGGGGGGGTPGGSDTQVQINSSGTFSGDPDFTFTGGNTLNVDVAIVDAETYGAGWNGDNSVPTKNDTYDYLVKYVIDQDVPSTAGGTITLDMNSQIQRSHVGSASFSTSKVIALSNTTNSLFFNCFLDITNVAGTLTVPSDWWMTSVDFNGTIWTPPATGKYLFGGQFDDANNVWYVTVSGPFIN